MEVGQNPALFWDQSFREYQATVDGASARALNNRNEAMSAAWHMAAFQRSKKMPRLKEVLQEPKSNRQVNAQALQSKVASWLANRKRKGSK